MDLYRFVFSCAVGVLSLVPGLGQSLPAVSSNSSALVSNSEDLAAADDLFQLGRVSVERGELAAAEKYYGQSGTVQEKLAPASLAQANSLNGLGDVAEQQGDLRRAEDYYCRALAISRKLGPDGTVAANSLYGLGKIALDGSDWRKAEEYLAPALALHRRTHSSSSEIAVTLNALAQAHWLNNDLPEAERLYRQAMALAGRPTPDSLITAESLAGLGAVAYSQAAYARAETYHRRAFAIREKRAPHSLAVANSLYWLAKCCGHGLDRSEDYAKQALAIQEELAPNSLAVAMTLNFAGSISFARREFGRALEQQHRALDIQQRLAPDSLVVASTFDQLSWISSLQGDLDQAREYAQQALVLRNNLNANPVELAASFEILGGIAFDSGDLAGADEYYRQAWAFRQRLGPSSLDDLLSVRGRVAQARGDLSQAWTFYRRALLIRQKTQPGSIREAFSLFELGSVAYDRGQLAAAEDYQQRALRIWARHPPVWSTPSLRVLGDVAQDRGELTRAEKYFRQVLEIEEKTEPGSWDDAGALTNVANVLCKRGEFAQAENYYRSALAITEKLAPQKISYAEVLVGLASVMRHTARPDEAAQFYEQALNTLEAQTARLGGGDDFRSSYRASHAGYYAGYINLLLSRNQPELAFQVQERFRARTLLEMLVAAHIDIRQGVDSSLAGREHSLQQLLAAKSQRRVRLVSQEHSEEQLSALDHEIENLLKQYTQVKEEIRSTSPAYASLTQPQPISVNEVQQSLLDANTLLLEYALGDEQSYLWAVTSDSVTAYPLPQRAAIESAATDFYAGLTSANQLARGANQPQKRARRKESATEKDYESMAANLSRMVLSPIAGQLAGKRLLIVADGALEYIPFAALPEPAASRFTPLVLGHEIVNLPSASVGAVLRQQAAARPPATNAVAVIADPVFDQQDPRVSTSGPKPVGPIAYRSQGDRGNSAASNRLTRSLADVGERRLQRLPFSRMEAEAILAVTPGKKMGALDFRASRTTAISSALAQYRIVHFATHGLLNSKHPELSGLVLSMVNRRGKPQDGFLDLADIYNLKLSADLVVLSACETGLGKQVQGEGLVGLTRGFMYAGATSVGASLWKVSDIATATLMRHFYQAMEQQGMTPPAALRSAQIAMLKQQRWRRPYYWAAFQIHGEGSRPSHRFEPD